LAGPKRGLAIGALSRRLLTRIDARPYPLAEQTLGGANNRTPARFAVPGEAYGQRAFTVAPPLSPVFCAADFRTEHMCAPFFLQQGGRSSWERSAASAGSRGPPPKTTASKAASMRRKARRAYSIASGRSRQENPQSSKAQCCSLPLRAKCPAFGGARVPCRLQSGGGQGTILNQHRTQRIVRNTLSETRFVRPARLSTSLFQSRLFTSMARFFRGQ